MSSNLNLPPFQNKFLPQGRPARKVQPIPAIADYSLPNRQTDPGMQHNPPVIEPDIGLKSCDEAGLLLTTVRSARDLSTQQIYEVSGNFFWFSFSTNATDVVFVRLGDKSDFIPMQAGTSITGLRFNRVYVANSAIVGARAFFAYGTDPRINIIRFG